MPLPLPLPLVGIQQHRSAPCKAVSAPALCLLPPHTQAEGVRDAALSAGRCFVEAYARSCMSLLLPAVETGMSGDNWRIRQSSLELCGDMLFKVSGLIGRGALKHISYML